MGQLRAEYIATLNQCFDEKELSLEFKVLIRKKARVIYVQNITNLSLEFYILIKEGKGQMCRIYLNKA